MNKTGRLTLIKTTLTAMPIYTPINLELQIWLLKGMTKLMKGFLWSGTEVEQGGGGGGKCLVAWSKVQRPLELGGMGVLDLQLMDRALHTRWLWLQHSEH
jgi:hypothetical protein